MIINPCPFYDFIISPFLFFVFFQMASTERLPLLAPAVNGTHDAVKPMQLEAKPSVDSGSAEGKIRFFGCGTQRREKKET